MDERWYLEITPTYHFTSDGYNEDRFREERLKGIKRLERNPAVIANILMWEEYLRRPFPSLYMHEYKLLSFAKLKTLEIDNGIPDEIWYGAEEGEDAEFMKNLENQPTLFGL